MNKKVTFNGKTIEYELQYKNVKNINLRIKTDGKISVSASKFIPQKVVEKFILSKFDFIVNALENIAAKRNKPRKQYFSENEVKVFILEICRTVFSYFEDKGVNFPRIKFRKMISMWGSCNSTKGVLNFNTNLMFAPPECIEYVVLHEFTHFLQPNHSAKFYDELAKVCPDWRRLRNKLSEINIK